MVAGVWLALVSLAPSPPEPSDRSQATRPAPSFEGIPPLRYEPIGLSIPEPYRPGKIPVVLIHGLWGSPWQWQPIVRAIEAAPGLRDRYQVWTFGYSTGDPIPHSALLLRDVLRQARLRLDPERKDPAFDRMVIVGHSMGGLLTKMMAQQSGERLWELIAARPFGDLKGEQADREMLRACTAFEPVPEVRRVIYVATPHRGSEADRSAVSKIGSTVIRTPGALQACYGRLRSANPPEFFNESFRKRLPTSLDELRWQSPILMQLCQIELSPGVVQHSIIADRRPTPGTDGNDGLVSYRSAHLDGTASEKLVASGHMCLGHPDVAAEILRILAEHAGAPL